MYVRILLVAASILSANEGFQSNPKWFFSISVPVIYFKNLKLSHQISTTCVLHWLPKFPKLTENTLIFFLGEKITIYFVKWVSIWLVCVRRKKKKRDLFIQRFIDFLLSTFSSTFSSSQNNQKKDRDAFLRAVIDVLLQC